MIYFVWIKLNKTVHYGCMGFTDSIDKFVETDDKEKIESIVKKYLSKYEKDGVELDRIRSCSLALIQDINKYTFPENILRDV